MGVVFEPYNNTSSPTGREDIQRYSADRKMQVGIHRRVFKV
jgi:hypothetical protein